MVENGNRCFDCLAEFAPDAPRFVVLKQMRDIEIPPDAIEPPSFFQSMALDPVAICEDCAGWYGDQVIQL